MKVLDRTIKIEATPQLFGDTGAFEATLKKTYNRMGLAIYELELSSDFPAELPMGLSIRWRIPSINVKGEWSTGALYDKRIRADWMHSSVVSRISVNAPVISLFGLEDENVITFACADAINTLEMEGAFREEDNFVYCQFRFFTEKMPLTTHYTTKIRVDQRAIPFSEALQDVGEWWSSFESLKPAIVPEGASYPIYSTWYSYHQNFEPEQLLKECQLSAKLGYQAVIIDDGWQTTDGARGYDYTGDWIPERIPNTRAFVKAVHDLGMKCMFWYSVPFCGKKSNAYQHFKGKFLTEVHPWAPVFDPRYPEVRAYLIEKWFQFFDPYNLITFF